MDKALEIGAFGDGSPLWMAIIASASPPPLGKNDRAGKIGRTGRNLHPRTALIERRYMYKSVF
jgi:hypothetical protein